MVMEKQEFDEFISELIKYYELSMEDISKSIEELAKIQEKYPNEYDKFQKVSENPELLLGLKMSDKIKTIFFELLLKSSTITQKVNKLIILTPIEKKALAKDLNKYVAELKTKFEEIKNDE